jgi:hypothetical protein
MSLDLIIPYKLITAGGTFSKHSPTVEAFPLVTNTTPDNVILTEKVGNSEPGMYQWNGNLFRWQFLADYETVTSQLFGLADAIICLMPANTSILPIGDSGSATITVYRNGVEFSDYTVTSQGIQLTRPTQENDTYLILQTSSLRATSSPGIQDAPNDGNNYVRKNQAWNSLETISPTELGASSTGAEIFTAVSTSAVVNLLDVIPNSQIGAANGVAPLDSSSKVPIANLPGAILGAVTFQGIFTTGTSTLPAAATGNKGWYYVTSAAGTYTPPGGTLLTFSAGDYLISDGTQWNVIDTQDSVISVNGKTGEVVLEAGDITTGIFAPAQLGTNNANNTILTVNDTGNTTWVNQVPSSNLPVATDSNSGIIRVGQGLSISGSTLSADVRTVAGRTGNVTLTVADINGAAPLASPTFTGTPTVPTATADTNNTQAASTAYVTSAIATAVVPPYMYGKVYWVDAVNGLDTNPGSFERPWKTLTKASTTVTGSGVAVFVAPGTYSDSVNWTAQNCDIVGMCSRSNLVNITGEFTFNHTASSVRCSRLGFTGGLNHTGAGSVYLTNAQVAGFTRSSTGYFEAADCDFGDGNINITGAGTVVFLLGKYSEITINALDVLVSITNAINIVTTNGLQVQNGVLRIDGSAVTTTAVQGTAITTTANGVLVMSSTILSDAGGSPTPITVAGGYSFQDVIYNAATSNITGMPLPAGFVSNFDSISVTNAIIPSTTAGIKGTVLADNANAGSIGEYLEILTTDVALVSGDPIITVASLAITPGDWDIQAFCNITPVSPAAITLGALELTSNPQVFLEGDVGTYDTLASPGVVGWRATLSTGVIRINNNVSTNIDCNISATWTGGGTATVTTKIRARRIR